MSGWWETPYKGGPMVPVPGFPRPLYPPDAAAQGKQPSSDGPDVEAYKRTVWRAGRWPGPASGFDRAFSNGFAHGKGPNVADSGLAGVQRQQNLDDTGWVGEQTFNTLRSIRVPQGPHEGEMAMDANAANLVAEAWQKFAQQPPPAPNVTRRQKALNGARKWLGTKESPPESNNTVFGSWYGVNYQPWCAIFAAYCFEVEAGGSPSFVRGTRYAYVPYIVSDARNGMYGLKVTTAPIPGDLVCYDWYYDGTFDHVGIFDTWGGTAPNQFYAVEGNTSESNDSNGGEVMRRQRSTASQSTVFVRVAEP